MKSKVSRYIYMAILVIALVMIDIVAKILFEGKEFIIFNNLLYIHSTHNYGAGLGIFSGKTIFLIIISFIFICVFIFYDIYSKNKHKLFFISMVLVLAGAFGNLIDRIALGYVRDYIYVNISIMPYYFNIADIFITAGVICMLVEILFKGEHKKKDAEISNSKEWWG